MFWILSILVFILDRISKIFICSHFLLHDSYSIIDGFLSIIYVQNVGAAFSILSGQRIILLVIAFASIFSILYYRYKSNLSKLMDFSFGLIAGGALGNMIDRFFFGYVVDFISIGWWPVFNIADIAISCGAVGLFFGVLFQDKAGNLNEN